MDKPVSQAEGKFERVYDPASKGFRFHRLMLWVTSMWKYGKSKIRAYPPYPEIYRLLSLQM